MNKKTKYIICISVVIVIIIGVVFALFFMNDNSEPVKLKIDCDGKDLSNTYKKGDKIECSLLGSNFQLTIRSVSDDRVVIDANSYGLCPRSDNGAIGLTSKVKRFNLYKGEQLVLALQATDVSSDIEIDWED